MKIAKKIILVIILVVFIMLDIWIMCDFEEKILRYGIIDKDEKTVVEFKYSTIDPTDLIENREYITAYKEDIFGELSEVLYIDLDGNEYIKASKKNKFKDEMPSYKENRAHITSDKNGKEGYIDWNKKETSKFIYDYASDYENGYAKVGIYDDTDTIKYGVIDLKGKEVVPCIYDSILEIDANANIFYVEQNETNYIVEEGNNIIAEYDDENFKFIELNELSLLEDFDDEMLITQKYICVKKDNKFAIFDRTGKQQTEFIYDNIENSALTEDVFIVEESGKKNVIILKPNNNLDNKKFKQNEMEVINVFENKVLFKKNNKFGIADFSGKIIVEPEYEGILTTMYKKGCLGVVKENEYGVIDLNGNEVIKCSSKYKSQILGNGEYFWVEKINGKLMAIYVLILIVSFAIEILSVRAIFKRKKV